MSGVTILQSNQRNALLIELKERHRRQSEEFNANLANIFYTNHGEDLDSDDDFLSDAEEEEVGEEEEEVEEEWRQDLRSIPVNPPPLHRSERYPQLLTAES